MGKRGFIILGSIFPARPGLRAVRNREGIKPPVNADKHRARIGKKVLLVFIGVPRPPNITYVVCIKNRYIGFCASAPRRPLEAKP
jgi:hypothetical protein